jgi:hypothetical protein
VTRLCLCAPKGTTRSFAFLILVALVGTACGGGHATTEPAASVPARENVSFFYQEITRTTNLSGLGHVKLVVGDIQKDDSTAAARVKATGAKAYRYVQSYWFPRGRTYDGLDIGAHPDWAFCATDNTPMAGRTDEFGKVWWFLDMNEQPVHEYFLDKFRALKAAGWDGIFLDRGDVSLIGDDRYRMADRVSTCTGHPVRPGATFADSYVGIMAVAKEAGVALIINYGISPFDPRTPLRSDAWRALSPGGLVLDESVSHPRDEEWTTDFAANLQNEQNRRHGGRVIGLLGAASIGAENRQNVYYGWARVKLFAMPLGVNTGDAGCADGDRPCDQFGLYPELANLVFGRPVTTRPASTQCDPGDSVHCLWSRRYQHGMSLLNVSSVARTALIPIGVDGCRYVFDLFTKRPIGGNHCVTSVSLRLGPWEGHPLHYDTKPF